MSGENFGLFDTGLYWERPVENYNLTFASDVSPELATSGYDMPLRDWSLFTGTETNTSGAGGILQNVKAGADSLLGIWGTVQGYRAQADEMKLRETVADADREVRLATIDANRTRLVAEAGIEKLRAETAMQRAADSARGGIANYVAKVDALPYVLGAVALGLAFFGARKKGGK